MVSPTTTHPLHRFSLYGAYKQANEWTARVYAADWKVGSVGLRPSVVYGLGRDQGLTYDATKAMLAAAAGVSGHIAHGETVTYQHAQDMAAIFIAATRMESRTAVVHISEIAAMIDANSPGIETTYDTTPLPAALDNRWNRSRPDHRQPAAVLGRRHRGNGRGLPQPARLRPGPTTNRCRIVHLPAPIVLSAVSQVIIYPRILLDRSTIRTRGALPGEWSNPMAETAAGRSPTWEESPLRLGVGKVPNNPVQRCSHARPRCSAQEVRQPTNPANSFFGILLGKRVSFVYH